MPTQAPIKSRLQLWSPKKARIDGLKLLRPRFPLPSTMGNYAIEAVTNQTASFNLTGSPIAG